MRFIDREQFNAEKDVSSMGVRAQIYPVRESEVKVRPVHLTYQRLARKAVEDELYVDEEQDQVQEGDRARRRQPAGLRGVEDRGKAPGQGKARRHRLCSPRNAGHPAGERIPGGALVVQPWAPPGATWAQDAATGTAMKSLNLDMDT